MEVDNSLVHNMFEPLVSSGFAFCAKRWVATLIRQCQWLETTMARRTCFSTDGGIIKFKLISCLQVDKLTELIFPFDKGLYRNREGEAC